MTLTTQDADNSKEFEDYINSAPNTNYISFFKKISEYKNIPNNTWTKNHVLGYFVFKFNSKNTKPYVFKYNSMAPSKSFEVFQISKLGIHLSQDPIIVKNYIDWLFDVKLVGKKISSISALTKSSNLEEFKYKFLNNLLNQTLKRSDQLSIELYNLIKNFNSSIKTYGDLAFLYNSNPKLDVFIEISKVFDLTKLSKVI